MLVQWERLRTGTVDANVAGRLSITVMIHGQ